MFRDLAGDYSASVNLSTTEIDQRINYALLCEDSGRLVDLRNQPSKNRDSDWFKIFFEETEWYLSNDDGVAMIRDMVGNCMWQKLSVSLTCTYLSQNLCQKVQRFCQLSGYNINSSQ